MKEVYNFFQETLLPCFNYNRREAALEACSLSALAVGGGSGSSREAKAAYQFLYDKLLPYYNYESRKTRGAACRLAARTASAGNRAGTRLGEVYQFYYDKLLASHGYKPKETANDACNRAVEHMVNNRDSSLNPVVNTAATPAAQANPDRGRQPIFGPSPEPLPRHSRGREWMAQERQRQRQQDSVRQHQEDFERTMDRQRERQAEVQKRQQEWVDRWTGMGQSGEAGYVPPDSSYQAPPQTLAAPRVSIEDLPQP